MAPAIILLSFMLGVLLTGVAVLLVWYILSLREIMAQNADLSEGMEILSKSQVVVAEMVDAAISEFRQTSAYQKRVLEEMMDVEIITPLEEGENE
jgi:Na+-transporting NADH:ubiquinone oxidoreductase subunit NqrC